jgi:hypothetical protein
MRDTIGTIVFLAIMFVCSHVIVHATGLVPYRGAGFCVGGLILGIILYAAVKFGMALAKRWMA